MASIEPHKGKWRVFIFKLGVRKTKVFDFKAQAVAWANQTEADIVAGNSGNVPNKTFGDLLQKYSEEVSPTKRGSRWEIIRIKKYLNDPIAKVHLRDLNSTHFAEWRDRRLKEVGDGSVLREWNILSNACKVARDEWKWMSDNPLKAVKKPKKPTARKRIATPDENERMLHCAGYSKTVPLTTATLRVFAAYLFANEMALRAGELCALEWHEVFIDKGYLKVTGIKPGARKNNAAVRDVPLTTGAIKILRQVDLTHSTGSVFGLSTANLDALFRKVRDRAAVSGLNFHDSRHAAITMLSRHYDVLELARIVGHTNLGELLTYYNPTIDDLVKKAP